MSQPAPPFTDRHAHALHVSTALSAYYVERFVPPLDIIAALNRHHVSFVLAGSHAIGGWIDDPRAAQDVDVVVAGRQVERATRALLGQFRHLKAEGEEVVVRLRDRESGKVLIDLIKPHGVYRVAFKHTHAVSLGGHPYRIPSLAMALAATFATITSPTRRDDEKLQAAHDFIRLVEQNPGIDGNMLTRPGEAVRGGGGAGLCEMVRKVRAGEKIIRCTLIPTPPPGGWPGYEPLAL